ACVMPPGGEGARKLESSSRPHPRKFGLKRFLAVRKVLAGKWGSLFLGYLLGKNIGGEIALISFPLTWDGCSSLLPFGACYPSGRKHGRSREVKRREFITLLCGAGAAWPVVVRAQQAPMALVGLLSGTHADDRQIGDFRQSLKEAGYIEGRNVAIK